MKFITFLTLTVVAIFSSYGSPMAKLPITSRLTQEERARLRRLVKGCNANVCFAIDGSGSLSPEEFEAEKNFVLDVVSIITVDDAVELAGVQYGIASSPISPLTTDFDNFILKVADEPFLDAGGSFVVAGVNYCFSQLFRRRGEANKIVLLGDGRSNIGASAVRRADLFRTVGGEVCTVGAGFTDNQELLDIAGGDPNKVFNVDSFLDALALQAILEDLVLGICGPSDN